jgi:hypothetical protein
MGDRKGRQNMPRALTLSVVWLIAMGVHASGQGVTAPAASDTRPAVGGTRGLPPPPQLPRLSGSQDMGAKLHRNPTGQPCLTVNGFSQPQTINPKIFTHTIFANNGCSQPIKMQVCYYKSQHCVPVDVPGYGRKEAVLGVLPAMKDFRFEYREQF